MTVWFVVPAANVEEFKTIYLAENIRGPDNQDEPEIIDSMTPNLGKTHYLTGTSRMTDAARLALEGRKPAWLDVYTQFPKDWEYDTGD